MAEITVTNDLELVIATAPKRFAKKWKNKKLTWQELVNKCANTKRTEETIKEYLKMSRDEQANIKDVGGFVGGFLTDGIRKTPNVQYRTLATLDLDYANADVWEEFTSQYSCAALLYSTHKHTKEAPRYRLVIPFNRMVMPQEYEPICRRIAYNIGIELFDITTYQLPRLFYWPSTAKNGEFEFQWQDGYPLNADEMLNTYIDWRNASDWPTSLREGEIISREIRKVGDPLEKPGLIGAFCQSYTIEEAIEKFLPEVYERTITKGRYTYRQGHVAAGLVCYDGKFAYSHHETDPAHGQLLNAFDIVRIGLFGAEDEGSKATEITKKPSYLRMTELASKDRNVKLIIARKMRDDANETFEGIDTSEADTPDVPDASPSGKKKEKPHKDDAWLADLDCDGKGKIKSTSKNIITVMENDPKLKDHIWHNDFTGFDMVRDGLPWDEKATAWTDRDDGNLRVYLEENYGLTGKDKVKDAKTAVVTRHRCHPVRDYLNALEWDGKERLDTLIIRYLGAEDCELNRMMTRKHFAAAVARVMEPGCKYDYCLIFTGAEGIGKSTLLNVMGGDWFNDTMISLEGKQGMEQLRGSWIIELGELSSIKRSDVESVKSFISRQVDVYRAAYGVNVEQYPRQCVFCGTTNETLFLKGDTGNRRFWVIKVTRGLPELGEKLTQERDQLWAEAVQRYRDHERLYLSEALEREARERQKEFNDDADNPLRSQLTVYLERLLPTDWDSWDLQRRRAYYNDPDPLDPVGVVKRKRVCCAEFICEQMRRDMSDKEFKYLARQIGKMLDDMSDWERMGSSRHAYRFYGVQRAWRRIESNDNDNTNDNV